MVVRANARRWGTWAERTVLCLGLPCLALSGCSAPSPHAKPLGQQQARITDGTDDAGHLAVGLLLIGASGGTAKSVCTATLVGQHTILTATHCLEVGETTLFQIGGKLYTVVKMIRRTDWNEATSKYVNDIGLGVLDGDVPNIAPMKLSKSAPTVGTQIALVGFGITSDAAKDAGTKRKANNTIKTVQPGYFTVEKTGNGVGNACKGDSGGPVLALVGGVETVLGVMSAANAPCGVKSYHVRVDVFIGWLETEAAGDIGGAPADAGVSDKGGPNDAAASEAGASDGGVLPDQSGAAGQFGDVCTKASDCASGLLCRPNPIAAGSSFCTQVCDTSAGGTGCPTGSQCSPQGNELLCDPPSSTTNLDGDGCAIFGVTEPPIFALLALVALLLRRRRL